jgi:DNA-binding transcriptional regulator LsrR (DeoR family)
MSLRWKDLTEHHKARLIKLVEEPLPQHVVADRLWLSEKQVSRYYKRAKQEQVARDTESRSA